MNNNIKAVYIHIPFCKSICSYCDFCKRYYQPDIVSKYLDALEDEIKKNYQKDKIETLYIGGGTPSILSINELKRLFNIITILDLSHLKEFTFECNIDDIEEEKMRFLFSKGVNRISIGIETINEKLQKIINRCHHKEEIKEKIKLLKKIGFNNINVDLIYAIPGENITHLKNDLDFILELDIEHISTYSLIIEPNTILYIHKTLNIDEELDLRMYKTINKTLKNKGFKHYEISNFSKAGYESKHNLTYWNNLEYYGFGLGASGYINDIRYSNTKSLQKYLQQNYKYEVEEISINQKMENEIILGLRKREGVNKKLFFQKYNKKIEDVFALEKLINNKYLINQDDYIYVNPKYLYVINSILVNFIGGLYE